MSGTSIIPSACYRDPAAAAAWLCAAFGFEIVVQIEAPDGDPANCHYEIGRDQARIAIGGRWADWTAVPDGTVTGWLSVHLPDELGADGLDAHCAHARAAGAVIDAEPVDEFFGARRYRAVDPEGHRWSFQVQVREVSRAEAEEHLGIEIARWE